MTGTAQALQAFFGGFGLPAFTEYDVPDEMPDEHGEMHKVTLPYITYQLVEPDWRGSAMLYARVWTRSTSYAAVLAIVDRIRAAVGEGVSLPTESGAVWLFKGSPFAQNMPMEGDDTLKVVYLNFVIHALTD